MKRPGETTTHVFQREHYDGVSRALATWWTLRKGQSRAVCRMFTHVFGHELRLEVKKQLVASQVCRTDEEVLSCQERWRAGLEEKGWKK
jgi:hypothetical protein